MEIVSVIKILELGHWSTPQVVVDFILKTLPSAQLST